jgi:hypothetical protein
MITPWHDTRWISDSAGHTVTVWSYKPRDGQHILSPSASDSTPFSGTGPGSVGLFTDAISRHGHAILDSAGSRPWHHHVAGCGVGHDDAQFAESGVSMAAYYESGEAYGGYWWDKRSSARRQYLAGRRSFRTLRRPRRRAA